MNPRASGTATTLIVSPRGQITLPKRVRARLRLTAGSVLFLREQDGKIVLDPAAVTLVALYSDGEVARLLQADQITAKERTALRRRWRVKGGARRRRARG